jgi:hypothetical protein
VITFVVFQIELILAISSAVMGVRALWRRDYECVGMMMMILLCCVIGLFCDWWEFVRQFSAIYGMEWIGAGNIVWE